MKLKTFAQQSIHLMQGYSQKQSVQVHQSLLVQPPPKKLERAGVVRLIKKGGG
ncbi:MAG: hypothetical protein IBX50_12000 [Marinospirillum sp.]|uniref:hypothetical protein n=1 Tax=Marinospirillum sp. TaxID=2183934 RepID=UPI0019DA4667|nr:hypothetical protein [Marinospirillum sp.]MBE0507419.1 hypothetical protein [Marinospirillum sp.]